MRTKRVLGDSSILQERQKDRKAWYARHHNSPKTAFHLAIFKKGNIKERERERERERKTTHAEELGQRSILRSNCRRIRSLHQLDWRAASRLAVTIV